MTSSIITTLKNWPIDMFVNSLSRWPRTAQHELIIVAAEDDTLVFADYGKLQIKTISINCAGAFPKSRATNVGIRAAQGEMVTIFDADCVFLSNPFAMIEKIAASENREQKHGWRVRYLSQAQTEEIYQSREINVALTGAEAEADVEYQGMVTGCSHFTWTRQRIIEIGGYDEMFSGWGAEDTEFNMRAFKMYGDTKMIDGCDIYHLYHPSRRDDPTTNANLVRFHELGALGWPRPDKGI